MSGTVGGAPHSSPLRIGDPVQLGPYRVRGRIGEGGMGSVFLAEAPDGRLVALKVIRDDLAHDEEFRLRFRSEVARARQVPPFCTAEVLDADTEHEPPYLVVEYVDGPSLAVVVRDRGPLSPANQHGLAVGVAVALTAIHGAGIIHRDLKPSNVLLAPGSPKVIDFGIARDVSNAGSQTRTDQVLGTVGYMAPERFGGKASGPLTPASDIFSWGSVVAYAASGDSPFAADVPAAIAVRIMTEQPNLDAVPRPLRDVVAHSLAKNPADRPTARELLDHLLGANTMPAALPQQGAQQTFALQTEVLAAAGIQPTHIRPDVVSGAAPVAPTHPYTPRGPSHPGGPPRRPVPPPRQPQGYLPPQRRRTAPPRRRRGAGVAIVLLSLTVLLLAATVAGVATGYVKLPGTLGQAFTGPSSTPELNEPPATTPPEPTIEPEPTITLSASPDPVDDDPTVIPGSVLVLDDAFPAGGALWLPSTLAAVGGECTVDGALTASFTQPSAGSFRCRGIANPFTDFTVKVDAELGNTNSCAGVWFRYSDSVPGGYAVKICHDRVQIVNHTDKKITILREYYYAAGATLAPGIDTSVAIRVEGATISIFRGTTMLGSMTDVTFTRGRIALGVFAYLGESVAPYEATFHRVQILEPA